MNLTEFLSYKDKGYTHIPVYEEFVADLIKFTVEPPNVAVPPLT